MKIIILGIKTTVLDEGAKNVATNLSRALDRVADTLMIHQRKAFSPAFLHRARRFAPDLVLSIHGPSPRTVLLLLLLKLFLPSTRFAIIGTQPHGGKLLLMLLRLLKPDFLFAQSSLWHNLFSKVSACTWLLANGVDTEKFCPPRNPDQRFETRAKYGFSPEDRLVIHAGPVNLNRNLELLLDLRRKNGWKVLVIGSTTAPYVPELAEKLRAGGVTVINEYITDINNVYSMADAYVFPVMDPGGSIENPLTVLEAMSCDTPVVTTRFRGLPDILPDAPALRFFSHGEQLAGMLEEVAGKSGNRQAISSLDWHNIAAMIIEKTQQPCRNQH